MSKKIAIELNDSFEHLRNRLEALESGLIQSSSPVLELDVISMLRVLPNRRAAGVFIETFLARIADITKSQRLDEDLVTELNKYENILMGTFYLEYEDFEELEEELKLKEEITESLKKLRDRTILTVRAGAILLDLLNETKITPRELAGDLTKIGQALYNFGDKSVYKEIYNWRKREENTFSFEAPLVELRNHLNTILLRVEELIKEDEVKKDSLGK